MLFSFSLSAQSTQPSQDSLAEATLAMEQTLIIQKHVEGGAINGFEVFFESKTSNANASNQQSKSHLSNLKNSIQTAIAEFQLKKVGQHNLYLASNGIILKQADHSKVLKQDLKALQLDNELFAKFAQSSQEALFTAELDQAKPQTSWFNNWWGRGYSYAYAYNPYFAWGWNFGFGFNYRFAYYPVYRSCAWGWGFCSSWF
ncbi:MAG: hypothetical protein COT74_01195 [Bdellovibrionales bacterium CG10_big_fil_rev_8_21_14_0_10_45_34]|nr:MAG: hypothetical protein COT74_01195 [Bdellovibrionales bacterium CG10_big_fil_rev_8_21_14_0_10_45_34]